MARLLFGENAAQLTALQAAQIGAALATLSGVGGVNPLGKLQKVLGLDRLTVGTTAAPGAGTGAASTAASGASIAAGRDISKRVYVEAKQSTTGSAQVQVQVDLTKHLKLQTRLGNGTAIAQGSTPENDQAVASDCFINSNIERATGASRLSPTGSLQQRMTFRQLMRIPRGEAVPNGFFRHLVFRHRSDDLVVDEQAIDVQSLVARRIRGLELDRSAPFCILNAGQQRRLEQFRFVLALLHRFLAAIHVN